MYKKSGLKAVAFWLCFSILIETVYTGGIAAKEAENNVEKAAISSKTTESSTPYIIGEDTSKRTEHEKHFYLSDGSTVAALYDTPVHYKNEAGEYEEIDNSFSEKLTELETKTVGALLGKTAAGWLRQRGMASSLALLTMNPVFALKKR